MKSLASYLKNPSKNLDISKLSVVLANYENATFSYAN